MPLENKDASINSRYDPFQKILENIEQRDEGIHNLNLEILWPRDHIKWGNSSYMLPMYNFIHKVNINLSRFDGENNQDGIRWINKIEKYSEMCNIYGDNEKLSV